MQAENSSPDEPLTSTVGRCCPLRIDQLQLRCWPSWLQWIETEMRQLHVIARYRIHPGKFAQFRQIAAECLSLVRRKDVGTLRYDWYLSGDRRVCVTIEVYEECDAVLEHAANLGPVLDRLMSTADLSIEFYGTASQEVLAATQELPVTFYSLLQSLD